MFVFLLLVLLAEIAVVVALGQAIGVLTTVLLLVAVSVLGVAMLRRQGSRTLTALGDAMRNRRDPSPEMVDGMLVGAAAALVLFPGFVTDALALLLLFPPTRAVARRRVLRRAERRRHTRPGVFVVDSEVVHPDPTAPGPIVIESYREDRRD
ncbi:hypothetical protein BU204_03965 [Actinophytocola xanthii]|uniref:Exlusion protein FxsA n=1 Tax=Actinophytocola xanthii TaxID=1912961 RepID=A0A1Q8CXK7_9PSEU|nr:hypothetical protein BU204_03965 [Actinophytocola xanthii]